MGAADGDFDVQKYEIDKRILLFYVRELLRHIYTRWGILLGVLTFLIF
jgi:hypothetical protein